MATLTRIPDPVVTAAPLAVDTAGVGPALRRTRKRALMGTVVALALCIGVIGTWIALDHMYLARQDQLDRTTGQIDDVDEDGGDSTAGDVDLHYVWKGESRDARVSVSDAGDWYWGQSVTVLLDPERDFVTLPGENYKPGWLDPLALFLAFALVFGVVIGVVVVVATQRKLHRARASAWRTVTVIFIERRGNNDEISVVYLPDYSIDRIWLVQGQIPEDTTRAQVAGHRSGLVLRTSEDAKLMLARPSMLHRATTVRVAAYELREEQVGLRLESGRATHYVTGHLNRLAPDVAGFEAVRAATMRTAAKNVVLLQLGLSKHVSVFTRLTNRKARKRWPELVDRS